MKFSYLILVLVFSTAIFAQKGTVTGVVTDKELNNETLPFANVGVKGSTLGIATDENGKYNLSLNAGDYIISFSFLGYEEVDVPVTVIAGQSITLNKALGSGAYTLKDVQIQNVTRSREKETALLLDQKNAVEIKQSIGAQELSRKGVGDVATAVSKTTGIAKQEGSGNIYVRGMGDRYNATTLNGLSIPSNDPEKKNINLDVFSTDIVEFVSIDKVYSSRLYGDFAGGNVDIVSKDYSGKGFAKLNIGANANSNAFGDEDFRLQKGQTHFGFSTTDIPNDPLNSYHFETLQFEKQVPFAGNVGLSAGDSFNVGANGKLSLFATASFSSQYWSKNSGTAASGVNPTATGAGNEDGLYGRKFRKYTSYNYGTNSTAMGNIGYRINDAHKINYNGLFINTSAQSTEEYFGRIVDLADDGQGLERRSTYIKNSLFVNQLLGEHNFSERIAFNWGAAFNTVKGDMPDRTTNRFNTNNGNFTINAQSAPNNNRYFQNLTEDEQGGNAALDYKFAKKEEGGFNGKVTVGYNGKFKQRDFEAIQFNFKGSNIAVNPDNLDEYYNQESFANGAFTIKTFRGGPQLANALDPQTYNGDITIHAAFVNLQYTYRKLTGSLGFRGEKITQVVKWDTQLDPDNNGDNINTLSKNAYLPNLILKYSLTDRQNLRLGVSKTYTLPQFKERALFVYEDITEVHIGNPDLYPSDNYNVDLKWEMFPNSEELISLTAFGKYLENPINEVTIASSTNDISYVNTGDTGFAAGAEVEFKKLIFENTGDNGNRLSAGFNAAYTYTEQKLDSEKVKRENTTLGYQADFSNKTGKFTGASPLLINADLSYSKDWNAKKSNASATIAYSFFSDRVYSIGTGQRGDLVDKAVGTLDLILKSKVNEQLGIDFSFKNLLDPTYNRVQENTGGDVSVLSYKKGLYFSFGINYTF